MVERRIPIDQLRLSQIYLSQSKIDDVLAWFKPSLQGFEPIWARDFRGDGELYIADGHTRAYVAWLHGVRGLPYRYDDSEQITCPEGRMEYALAIEWCERRNLRHISALADRILAEADYEARWNVRCARMCNLARALLDGGIDPVDREEWAARGLFIYGTSEDAKILYCEDASGALSQIIR